MNDNALYILCHDVLSSIGKDSAARTIAVYAIIDSVSDGIKPSEAMRRVSNKLVGHVITLGKMVEAFDKKAEVYERKGQ